jgi:hypothetical protein
MSLGVSGIGRRSAGLAMDGDACRYMLSQIGKTSRHNSAHILLILFLILFHLVS